MGVRVVLVSRHTPVKIMSVLFYPVYSLVSRVITLGRGNYTKTSPKYAKLQGLTFPMGGVRPKFDLLRHDVSD